MCNFAGNNSSAADGRNSVGEEGHGASAKKRIFTTEVRDRGMIELNYNQMFRVMGWLSG